MGGSSGRVTLELQRQDDPSTTCTPRDWVAPVQPLGRGRPVVAAVISQVFYAKK